MITLYTYKTFYGSKVEDKLPLRCEQCGKTFHVAKRKIQSALKGKGRDKCGFCSVRCGRLSQTKKIELECEKCGNKFFRERRKIKVSKDGKQYCSTWCSNNRVKKSIESKTPDNPISSPE